MLPSETTTPTHTAGTRVGYVVKMYPRLSETFIVNEILAHERAGLDLEIFSLRFHNEGRFHPSLARVKAPVTYIVPSRVRATELWNAIRECAVDQPTIWAALEKAQSANVQELLQAIELASHVRERGLTHLHAHFGSTATTVARLAAVIAGVPFSFTAHAKDIYHESVDPADLRSKIADASSVITVSDFNLDHLRELTGAAPNVHRVYNGLDLEQFSYAPPADGRLILGVGRLVEKKGFDDLIRACALLRDRGVAFRAEIVGDGVERDKLHALVAELDLTSLVHLPGPLPQDRVIARMREATLLAAPCVVARDGNRDGLPTVLLEAMALGLPVIGTDVTGLPELISHEDSGLMVAQSSPEQVASAIVRLLDDEPLRLGLSRRGREVIEQLFDIDRNTSTMRRILAATPALAETGAA